MANPTDISSPEFLLQIAGLVGTGLIGLLGFSLKRNVENADTKVDSLKQGIVDLRKELEEKLEANNQESNNRFSDMDTEIKDKIGTMKNDLAMKLETIATDVRQLAATGARHGESLAAGVAEFKNINRRLDKLEDIVLEPAPKFRGHGDGG